jgi:hypothetical protein
MTETRRTSEKRVAVGSGISVRRVLNALGLSLEATRESSP